jgi:hypothetical protein
VAVETRARCFESRNEFEGAPWPSAGNAASKLALIAEFPRIGIRALRARKRGPIFGDVLILALDAT